MKYVDSFTCRPLSLSLFLRLALTSLPPEEHGAACHWRGSDPALTNLQWGFWELQVYRQIQWGGRVMAKERLTGENKERQERDPSQVLLIFFHLE